MIENGLSGENEEKLVIGLLGDPDDSGVKEVKGDTVEKEDTGERELMVEKESVYGENGLSLEVGLLDDNALLI